MDFEIGVIAFIVIAVLVFIAIQRNSRVHGLEKYNRELLERNEYLRNILSLRSKSEENQYLRMLKQLLQKLILKEIEQVFIQQLGGPEDLGQLVFKFQKYNHSMTGISIPAIGTKFVINFTHDYRATSLDYRSISVDITHLSEKRSWDIDEYELAIEFIKSELEHSVITYMDVYYADS